jgi:hypothetical protein
MADVYELRRSIREFIHHPRRLDPLLKDNPNWNQLASSFDVIADTEMAIQTYNGLPAVGNDKGILYLMIYGLLQALYVQQDAVESLVRALRPNQTPRYAIESEPQAEEIRSVRNRAIGHPTVQGNVNSKKTPGVQMSFHISQLWNGGFTLMTIYANGSHTFTEVKLLDLIEKNRLMVERILHNIKDELEAAEMEHRKQFRDKKLADIFPATLDYQFLEVFKGVRKLDTVLATFGKASLKVIAETVKEFREAVTQRGVLNRTSDFEYYLSEVEYPLAELAAYFEGKGSLTDPRAAGIFTDFLQDKVRGLIVIAREIDEEYAAGLSPAP